MIPHHPFYYLRHGLTDWNAEGRLQGLTDIPLNTIGVEQAQHAARCLHPIHIDLIVTSPLTRALQTAAIVAQQKNLPLHLDIELKERSFGSFEGLLNKEVRTLHNLPDHESINTILPPDAEQWPQTLARSAACLGRWISNHPGKAILFVGHGAFFRAVYENCGGPYLEAKNAIPYHFRPGKPWILDEISA